MMLKLRSFAGSVLLALLLLTPATAGAQPTPAPSEFYGANIQALIRDGFVKPASWPTFLGAGESAGLTIARFDASWGWAEPKPPGADGVHHYDWTRLDQVAAVLAGQGMRWLPVVDFPPGWASTPDDALPDASQPGFAAFAGAFAARYGPGGAFWAAHPELTPRPVEQMEVWTEANSQHFWTGNPDPARYYSVYAQVRTAVKPVAPDMQVLVSLGWQDFLDFTDQLYAAGLKGNADGIAFHPYAPTARGVVLLTRKLRADLVQHGEPDLPIFMTEIGWPRAPSGAGATRAYDGPVSDASRAGTASLTADALAASDCNVKDFIFYSLVEQQKDPSNIEDWLGLYNVDGTPTTTMQALSGSASRWSADALRARASGPPALLPLCFGPSNDQANASSPMPPDNRLPIQLSVPVPALTPCMSVTTRYFGNPLEEVNVSVRTYRGAQAGATTRSSGQAVLCMSAASRRKPFLVWARSGALASSPVLSCRGARCYPLSCRTASIRTRLARTAPAAARLRLSVRCGQRVLFGEPLKVNGIDARGHKHRLAVLASPTATQVVKLRWKPSLRLTAVTVRFGGDRTFQLQARTRRIRLGRLAAGRAAAPGRRAAG